MHDGPQPGRRSLRYRHEYGRFFFFAPRKHCKLGSHDSTHDIISCMRYMRWKEWNDKILSIALLVHLEGNDLSEKF